VNVQKQKEVQSLLNIIHVNITRYPYINGTCSILVIIMRKIVKTRFLF